jgi:ribosomal protein S18 acetylase RimI-like enzyme
MLDGTIVFCATPRRVVRECRVANVRSADRDRDDAGVYRLWCDLIAHHKSVERVRPRRWQGPPEEWLRGILDKAWSDPRQAMFVAEDSGRVVGFVRAALDHDGPCPGRIETLIVERDQRGSGTGKQLMGAAHRWLRQQGADEVMLEVVDGNVDAQRFYAALGYKPFLVAYLRPTDEDR